MLPSGLIRVAAGTSAAVARIMSLIDALIEKQPDSRLLANVTRTEVRKLEATIQAPHLLADRLGHSNSDFPLADHQREVLAHLARADAGDILAVNGPPGTGKTTLLLSAIAGAWIKSALEGGDPALIVAASTNNQAVTNIIDAFGKDFGRGEGPFAGRWLPAIRSFGVFLASFTKEAEASKKYQTETFFADIENSDYLAKASVAYLRAGHVAFPALKQPTVSMIVDALRQLIQAGNSRLLQADDVHQRLASARSEVEKKLGANPELVVQARLAAKIESEAITTRTNEMLRKWEGWLAQESLLVSLFSFLPPIARKRTLRARLLLRELGVDEVVINGARIEHIDADLRAFVRSNTSKSQEAMASYTEADVALKELRKQEIAWQELYASLGGKVGVVPDIIEFDRVADRKLRFPLFLLATHYWEGRWLLEMEKTLPVLQRIRKDKKGENDRDIVLSMWRRRMMLTPCAVSTFATLPGKMTCRDNITGNFQTNYLFNNIDLLIVDEAGQALPEVAGPSFALAKKAMVIGDTQQIEPITSLPSSVDVGNLVATGLLSSPDDFATLRRFDAVGIRSKTGSAMRLAQSASRFHPYQSLERGLYLFEHRRCYDDIIRYCNELCYKGTLQPKRGTVVGAAMRPMAYLHVDGIAQEAGGSRFNVLEARTIAAWLAANAADLGQRYGKPIEKTVGIITPFRRQVSEIRRACEEIGINVGKEDGITIGTVHALQGAERQVVIFSPVYSKHADGGFIDLSPSMLNVAVSRAKDSFVVFGDMDNFAGAAAGTPRGLLARFLFDSQQNELAFEAQVRADLSPNSASIEVLRDAADHDAFMLKALADAKRNLTIVSPWINIATMEQVGFLPAIRRARERSVQVEIFADPILTRGAANRDTFAEAGDLLSAQGVSLQGVEQLHSKLVWADENLLAVGSFNWCSAHRSGEYARHETSIVYKGAHLETEISILKNSLRSRIAR